MDRTRPGFTSDERTQLVEWLQLQRAIVHWKCEGLSEEAARRAPLPASPLLSMAALVSHLRWVEHSWFEALFLNQGKADNPQFSDVEDADLMVGDKTLPELLEEYAAQCAVTDRIVAAHSLDDTGKNTDYASGTASLRWMMLHMIEETARHAGHADAIRELIDGTTGYY